MRFFISILSFFCCLVFGIVVKAEQDSISRDFSGVELLTDSTLTGNIGAFKLKPYVAASYTPETGVLFSAGGVLTFHMETGNFLLNRSSVPFSVGYSGNGSLIVNVKHVIYGKKDNWRSVGEFYIRNMPDHYWGVGYDKAVQINKGDSTTRFSKESWRYGQKLSFKVFEDFFVGAVLEVNYTRVEDVNKIMGGDPDFLLVGKVARNGGLGLLVEYDSRDFVQNSYKGVYFGLNGVAYGSYVWGTHKFQTIELDYRQYLKVHRKKRRVLAWQFKYRDIFGGVVPWTEFSQLGSPFDLRGYRLGHFRDRTMVFGLVEYRHMLHRRQPDKQGDYHSKFGFVSWMGVGSVGHGCSDFTNWLPNCGVGLRFETEPRLNVRIDVGFGEGERAAYVTFTEAF